MDAYVELLSLVNRQIELFRGFEDTDFNRGVIEGFNLTKHYLNLRIDDYAEHQAVEMGIDQ